MILAPTSRNKVSRDGDHERKEKLQNYTTSAAMAMEKYCNENSIKGRLIPVPRELSAGCGLAWRMEPGDYEGSGKEIEKSGIEMEQSVEIYI